MSRIPASILVLMSLLLAAGCASTYRVVEIPVREADMYPISQSRDGLTIAVDEIRAPGRAQRYFGFNLLEQGILPVAVVVSNFSDKRVVVKPSDVLMHRGAEIIDPLPTQVVSSLAKDQYLYLRRRTRERVDTFFRELAFKETVLQPGETYQGVMFFSNPRPRRKEDRFFTMWSLFTEGGPRIRVGVTDLDTRRRIHFGPFSLSSVESELTWARSGYWERF